MSENFMYDGGTVSVIGLGHMGTRLAQAFLAGGVSTTVWNRTAAKADALAARGAKRATTVAEAVSSASVVVVCLPEYDTVRALLEPVGPDLAGRVLVNLTSGTPESARLMSRWAADHGAGYLDGAAMSGTRLVGGPDALFVFSGAAEAFAGHRTTLVSLGNAVHLGDDPGLAAVYDTALFGLAWGALAGFYHALSLVGVEDVDPAAFAEVAAGHMPYVTSLMTDHARQVQQDRYPADDGTVQVHAAAMQHLVDASLAGGLRTDVPELMRSLLERAEAAGHGADGMAAVARTIRYGAQRVRD
ncbi:NAD(P)-dependent oxidoreductase [Streptomyces peucetius]|uniref:NAD(P)-binding domain-containing protein n=1 Tax=Streptomyces peucetius TaxID=1950 RepID=A0ABY6I1M9_STRPE|nr:NAD(P)-binding domain-containing protein [Streptomyces peucetius]UYQ60882.1 NAD(P)-binding domain-containing protein [Streptomyces peucetius]